MAQEKQPSLFTPKGRVTGFVNIKTADYKFDAAGVYKLKIILTADQGQPILEACERAAAEALKAWKTDPKNKGKRQPKDADLPVYINDDGEAVLSFKSKASYVDKKTGETKQRSVPVSGANGRLKPNQVPNFGEGSEVKVAFTIGGFCNPVAGAGATMRIEGVKLFKVVEFSGAGGDMFADDEDEGGYEAAEGYDDEADSREDRPAETDDF